MNKTEALLRLEIRKMIKKALYEQDEQDVDTKPEEETEETPEETPEEEPEEAPQENAELENLKARFLEKLRSIQGATDSDSLVQTISDIVDGFGMSNEGKLKLLQAVKSNVVR